MLAEMRLSPMERAGRLMYKSYSHPQTALSFLYKEEDLLALTAIFSLLG